MAVVLAFKTLTNLQPVKTYFVPLNQQRVEKLTFDVPAGTTSVKLSFADKSPNDGIAVDPLIKKCQLEESEMSGLVFAMELLQILRSIYDT